MAASTVVVAINARILKLNVAPKPDVKKSAHAGERDDHISKDPKPGVGRNPRTTTPTAHKEMTP